MKQFFAKFLNRFYDHNIELEKRMGTMFITIGTIAALCGLFVCLAAQASLWGIFLVGAIFLMIPPIMVISIRSGHRDAGRIVIIGAVIAAIPVVWFTCGGLHSGCSIWFVFEFFFIAIALRGTPLRVALGIASTLDLLCYVVSIFFPQYVFAYTGELNVFVATGGSMAIVSATVVLTVAFQKNIYNHERSELLRTRSSLQQANNYQKAFLANMSHEVRTPINAIIGMNEMILRENNIDEARKYATDIQRASEELLALVNDMLDFSRIESGNMEIVDGEYSVEELVSHCFNIANGRARDKGLDFYIRNNPKIPCTLLGDEPRIRQIISNLLSNSIVYTQRGYVSMTLDMERPENGVPILRVAIKDTGIGISPEKLDKIFDVGQAMDSFQNPNKKGSGLGLVISRNLVELMGGTIEIFSKEQEGTEIVINLPQQIVDDTPMGLFHVDTTDMPHTYEEHFHAPQASILVVDDIDLNLKVITGLLKRTQIKVDTALSGMAALEKCRVNKYDVIFMDHMMPEMDGIETFHRIRDEIPLNGDTPVVMLTANAIVGVKKDYLQEGFSDYISKPVKPDLLERVLRKYV